VLAKISFTSTMMVTRARRWMVWSSARRPIAIAPPSPLFATTWTGWVSAPQAVSESATSRTASASVGADSNTLWMIEKLRVKSSGAWSPRPHATTFGYASDETSAHEVPMVKMVLTPLSETRPRFWNATDSMQPGHRVEPGWKQLCLSAVSL